MRRQSVKLLCVLCEDEQNQRNSDLIYTFLGVDADDNYVILTAWNADVESLKQQCLPEQGHRYVFENVSVVAAKPDFNIGTVPFTLAFRNQSRISLDSNQANVSIPLKDYAAKALTAKFGFDESSFKAQTFAEIVSKSKANDLVSFEATIDSLGQLRQFFTIDSLGQLRQFFSPAGLQQHVVDVSCKTGKSTIRVTFWNAMAQIFSTILSEKENWVVQFKNVKFSGADKSLTFHKSSKIKLLEPQTPPSVSIVRSLEQAADHHNGVATMNLRLRVLTQPAISSKSNYVLVGTDSEFKAQVFTTFNPNVEIDDEFSITKATVEFKDEILSLTVHKQDAFSKHSDATLRPDEDLLEENLDYPSA
ncbi:hypothetical protein DdX_18075 [Ditylenchus destructor]|uniref:Uncharacterized protein n=1 Tax=Ditylenchus destructor TaxID=166010 RepID=A0AAD4MLW2_9BILA|nr:hypothetical protein DdX_18075 [Ditylenchus destructor]